MYKIAVTPHVKIAVYDLNPNCRNTVVMIHGWPLRADMYEYQRRFLAEQGYRVITLDLRGFGNSDAPACGYGYDQLANDIYTVIRRLGLQQFILVGFSMGGAIALRYMRLFHGYGVKKLVLLAAAAPRFTQAPDFPLGITAEAADQLIQLAKTDRAQLSQNFSRQLLASPHSEAILDWFRDLSLSASGIGTVCTGYSLRDEDGRQDLQAVHVPTGIFHGCKDEIVPFKIGVYQQQHIPGSRLFPFENSGHGIFYDELPGFNAKLLAFLRR